jgi:N6-adenosine-specific RNA methylase IME4
MIFDGLPRNHYRAILADPPWNFKTWAPECDRAPSYPIMGTDDISALRVDDLAADDAVLFLWSTWPLLEQCLSVIRHWGFTYKTCAFAWMKADQFRFFAAPSMGLGYWTRANTEPCLLATRGKPKRLNADVRQAIIEPRREHSRKPDCVHDRIERLVAGPYLELFARARRRGWDSWGNEVGKFEAAE